MVHPSVPAKTVPEFIAYAKTIRARSAWRRPATEIRPIWRRIVKVMTHVDMTHVPIAEPGRPSPICSVGRCRFISAAYRRRSSISGRQLRVLAVTTSTRFEGLPDVPTVADFVPGFEASQWFAVGLRRSSHR